MASQWKNREFLRCNFISRPLSQQSSLFRVVVVFALLLSLVATVTLWPFYSPAQEMVGKDMDDEVNIGNYQDWDLPASHPKMVQLAEAVNRTLAHLPSKFFAQEMVGKDMDDEIGKYQDWDLPASDPKMVQLAEAVNRTLAHLPSKFLPEYRNPCWHVTSPPSVRGSLRCLPYFFLIGYPKCGTTEIYQLLKQNPKFAGQQVKESHFLVNSHRLDEEFEDVYLNGYLRPATLEISTNHDKITGDLSPTYVRNLPSLNVTDMPSDATPFLFKTLFPHSKYIVTVRDPIDQVRSHFYYQLGENAKPSPGLRSEELDTYMKQQVEAYWRCVNETSEGLWCVFSWHYWKYLSPPEKHSSKSGVILLLQESIYYANLHLWLQHIKRENLLVVQLEDMKRDIAAVANKIYTFLGLPSLPASAVKRLAVAPALHQSFLHTSGGVDPYMKEETKRMLCELQRPFNKALVDLLPDEHFEWANSTYC